MSDENEMTFKTAGNRYPLLTVSTDVHTCGPVRDGVSLREHGAQADNRGSWVIAFSDLEAWYLAARAWRAELKTSALRCNAFIAPDEYCERHNGHTGKCGLDPI